LSEPRMRAPTGASSPSTFHPAATSKRCIACSKRAKKLRSGSLKKHATHQRVMPILTKACKNNCGADPSQDHGIAQRIPHLGHAALFFALIIMCVLLATLAVFVPAMISHPNIKTNTTAQTQIGALGMLLGYAVTFAIAFPIFHLLWKRSFIDGIHWTWRAVRLHWWKLIL